MLYCGTRLYRQRFAPLHIRKLARNALHRELSRTFSRRGPFFAVCRGSLWLMSTRAALNYSSASFAFGDALVFVKETAGLPQALLDAHPERALRVPMREGAVRSLNLSTSVGIVTYAALVELGFPGLR